MSGWLGPWRVPASSEPHRVQAMLVSTEFSPGSPNLPEGQGTEPLSGLHSEPHVSIP